MRQCVSIKVHSGKLSKRSTKLRCAWGAMARPREAKRLYYCYCFTTATAFTTDARPRDAKHLTNALLLQLIYYCYCFTTEAKRPEHGQGASV